MSLPPRVLRHGPYSKIAVFPDGYSARWEETVDQEWEPFHGDLRHNAIPFAHLERRSNGTWWVAPASTGRFGGKVTWRPVDMRLVDVSTSAGIVEAAGAALELLSDKQKGEAATPRPSRSQPATHGGTP